jgi:biotin transport system substrate-specific component
MSNAYREQEHRRWLVLAGLMAALTAAGAITAITIPFLTPVPFTLQVLAVFITAGLLPPRYAAAAQATYLLVGVLGVPVFAGGGRGAGVLLGPFGGYLLAYPVAAGVGSLLMRRPTPGHRVAGLGAALAIIYAGGALGLIAFAHLTALRALALGVVPFIGWDALKAALAYPVIAQVRVLLPAPRQRRHGGEAHAP